MEKTNGNGDCIAAGVVVVQQTGDGRILGESLPTQDIGIANNLRAIVGMEKSYLVIAGEDELKRR